MYFPHLIIWSL